MIFMIGILFVLPFIIVCAIFGVFAEGAVIDYLYGSVKTRLAQVTISSTTGRFREL